jgi:hypothetical protein
MPKWEDSIIFKGQNQEKKGKEKTPSDEPMVPQKLASMHASEYLVHYVKTQVNWHRRMNRRSIVYVRQMNCQRRSSEDEGVRWTDGPLEGVVSLSGGSLTQDREALVQRLVAPDEPTDQAVVHPTTMYLLTERFWLRSLQHRMNQHTVGWSVKWIVSVRFAMAMWRGGAPDEPTPIKRGAFVHPMVKVSTAFSQRLFGLLRLFIPPSLAHLRLLDCVEVQRSVRHIQDHIQAIQVLNCSSIDLHMLYVCA